MARTLAMFLCFYDGPVDNIESQHLKFKRVLYMQNLLKNLSVVKNQYTNTDNVLNFKFHNR